MTAYWIGHRHWISPKALKLFFSFLSNLSSFVNFVSFKCQNCHELLAFLGVEIGLKVLLRVKELTFCNSVGDRHDISLGLAQSNAIVIVDGSYCYGHNVIIIVKQSRSLFCADADVDVICSLKCNDLTLFAAFLCKHKYEFL